LGYLGVLPIINPEVIHLGLKLASALEMKINKIILFDRKIYNYFDLPKGYQITQQELPFANSGFLPIIKGNEIERIPIKTLQLEEDTAKSIYSKEGIKLDFNRAGNPLIELVTEPVFHHIKTVLIFIKQLQNLLRYLEISEAKMEKGQLRVDLNFSLQLGNKYSTPRYEIKNLNSLANIEKALKHEVNKHQLLFSEGQEPPISQTLGFDEEQQITITHREKTNYYYLPEVNIPPIKLKTATLTYLVKNGTLIVNYFAPEKKKMKKYEKNTKVDENQVEKELKILWNDDLAQIITVNRQKVQNYLLGQGIESDREEIRKGGAWQKLEKALNNTSQQEITAENQEKIALEKEIIKWREEIKKMKEERDKIDAEETHYLRNQAIINRSPDSRQDGITHGGVLVDGYPIILLKNIDKITNPELQKELMLITGSRKNDKYSKYQIKDWDGNPTEEEGNIDLSKFVLIATTSASNPQLPKELREKLNRIEPFLDRCF
ncbi:18616_t:CDS:2, partial [Funneliformis geosporum]